MIFSSHRFGQLTKPADLIMYVALIPTNSHLTAHELELKKTCVIT